MKKLSREGIIPPLKIDNNTYKIKTTTCIILYELGDGNIYEQEIFSYVGNDEECCFEFDGNEKTMSLTLKTNRHTKEINVNNENIYRKPKNNYNLLILIITIMSSLVIGLITLLVLLIRKQKINKI